MRKTIVLFVMALLFLASLATAETLRIRLERANLQPRPTSFVEPLATLHFGASVETVDKKGAWYYVKTQEGRLGYLHQTAVEERKALKVSGVESSGPRRTEEEIAAATKGFDAQVESEYRRKHSDLNYRLLDSLEQCTAVEDPLKRFHAFRKGGRLGEFRRGGG